MNTADFVPRVPVVSRIVEWVRRHLAWSKVRALGESAVVRSSWIWLALVPVAAKLVVTLRAQDIRVEPWASIIASLTLPFSWQWLFVVALVFSAANLLYLLACPLIVRENSGLSTFKDAQRPRSHLFVYAEQVAGPRRSVDSDPMNGYPLDVRLVGDIALVYDDDGNEWIGSIDHHHGCVDGSPIGDDVVFWDVWRAAQSHRILALAATTILYVAGLSLTAYLLLENARWVLAAWTA